jgi:hypothetical protein
MSAVSHQNQAPSKVNVQGLETSFSPELSRRTSERTQDALCHCSTAMPGSPPRHLLPRWFQETGFVYRSTRKRAVYA